MHLMRENTHRLFQVSFLSIRRFFGKAGCKPFIRFHIHNTKFRIFFQKMSDNIFIFPAVKCTGGIKKHSARPQHGSRLGNNISLNTAEIFRPMFLPRFYHLFVFTEHSFSGTGRIDEYFIEIFREMLCQVSRFFTGHKHIADTKQLNILQKSLCPGTADIICHQKAASFQLCAKFCGLPSGSSAQIQHPLSRFDGKTVCRRHGAWLLQIVKSGEIVRMFCRVVFFSIIIKSVFNPRNRPDGKRTDLLKFFFCYFFGIYPKSIVSRLIVACNIVIVLFLQKYFHFFLECLWQVHPVILLCIYTNAIIAFYTSSRNRHISVFSFPIPEEHNRD